MFPDSSFIKPRNLNDQSLTIEVADRQTLEFNQSLLIQAVGNVLKDHDFFQGEISIALVDDSEIRALNKQYLNHDYATDVISFVLDFDEDAGLLNGQLIVSTDTAQRVADDMSHPYMNELLLYVIHGTLHLVGYNDHEDTDIEEMRAAETKYLDMILSAKTNAPPDGDSEC